MQELTIPLTPKSKIPLYEQIYTYIKQDIQTGRIKAKEKLPSSRALSACLEVSRSTVDLAYEQLVSEGYLESIPCKGYYACQIEELFRFQKETAAGFQTSVKAEPACDYDFTPSGIDLDSFPYGTWRKITRNILLDDNKDLFQLGDPKGEWELRKTITSYLHQARGVNCRPEQVVIGAGNDYLLLLLSAILGCNRRIAMETPTYKHAYKIFARLGFALCTIPMDASGMQASGLEQSGAGIAYVMPSHQYPLGIVMPIKRRLELLSWAAGEEGRYIIEDDYDSEFRYKGKPIPALCATDSRGKVIYLGTFSKSIAPAIRVSYLVLPEGLLRDSEAILHTFSSTVSRIDQMILNQFLKEGHYERHLNRMRTIYGRKHELLLGELKKMSHFCHVTGEHAGVHLLVEFTNGMTEREGIERARDQGVKVYPLSEYEIGNPGEGRGQTGRKPTVILGYATLPEKGIAEAAERLYQAWSGRKRENK